LATGLLNHVGDINLSIHHFTEFAPVAPLFTGWNWAHGHPHELEDWAKTFFQTLSAQDQDKVKKSLGGCLDTYLKKKRPRMRLRSDGKYTLIDILQARRNPPKPDFLYKPPHN